MVENDIKRPFPAYDGDENYIFISYAHKDRSIVFPEIKRFHDEGFPIWYDDGLTPGQEWDDEIALALVKCSLLVVFISKNSMASRNVQDEIKMALNRDIDIVPIYLEETELPLALELRLSNKHAIFKHSLSDGDYNRDWHKAFRKAEIPHIGVEETNDDNIITSEVKETDETPKWASTLGGNVKSILDFRKMKDGEMPSKSDEGSKTESSHEDHLLQIETAKDADTFKRLIENKVKNIRLGSDFSIGEMSIDYDDVTIDGNGYTIMGAGKEGMFIVSGKNVTFKDLIFSGGQCTEGGRERNNFTPAEVNFYYYGGAIYVPYSGECTCINCNFKNNVVGNKDKAKLPNERVHVWYEAKGGAIYAKGTCNLISCNFSRNNAIEGSFDDHWGCTVI